MSNDARAELQHEIDKYEDLLELAHAQKSALRKKISDLSVSRLQVLEVESIAEFTADEYDAKIAAVISRYQSLVNSELLWQLELHKLYAALRTYEDQERSVQ